MKHMNKYLMLVLALLMMVQLVPCMAFGASATQVSDGSVAEEEVYTGRLLGALFYYENGKWHAVGSAAEDWPTERVTVHFEGAPDLSRAPGFYNVDFRDDCEYTGDFDCSVFVSKGATLHLTGSISGELAVSGNSEAYVTGHVGSIRMTDTYAEDGTYKPIKGTVSVSGGADYAEVQQESPYGWQYYDFLNRTGPVVFVDGVLQQEPAITENSTVAETTATTTPKAEETTVTTTLKAEETTVTTPAQTENTTVTTAPKPEETTTPEEMTEKTEPPMESSVDSTEDPGMETQPPEIVEDEVSEDGTELQPDAPAADETPENSKVTAAIRNELQKLTGRNNLKYLLSRKDPVMAP